MDQEMEIRCDKCGGTIEMDEGRIQERVVGEDKFGNVKERFFECPICGQHYTITVYNRSVMLKIQKRRQIRDRIRWAWGKKYHENQFRAWQKEDERLKDAIMNEVQILRRKYLREE